MQTDPTPTGPTEPGQTGPTGPGEEPRVWTDADRHALLQYLKQQIASGNMRYVSDERRRAKREAAARRRERKG